MLSYRSNILLDLPPVLEKRLKLIETLARLTAQDHRAAAANAPSGPTIREAYPELAALWQQWLILKYSADQPRVPAGDTGGGQWTKGEGSASVDGSTTPTTDIGEAPAGGGPSTEPLDSRISSFKGSDGRNVTVTFNGVTSDRLSGDQLVTNRLATTVTQILDDSGVNSVNISATTNGHSGGDHAFGDAVDINFINGVHVSNSGAGLALATQVEQATMINGNVRFVEGPAGNFARSSPGSSFVPVAKIPGDQTHVHISVFPVK